MQHWDLTFLMKRDVSLTKLYKFSEDNGGCKVMTAVTVFTVCLWTPAAITADVLRLPTWLRAGADKSDQAYVRRADLSQEDERRCGRPALLTAALAASWEHWFYWMLSITKPAMPAAEKQDCRNSPQQKQQQQQHALDTVRPQKDQKRRSNHPKARLWTAPAPAARSRLRSCRRGLSDLRMGGKTVADMRAAPHSPEYWYHDCEAQCMTQQRESKFYLFISPTTTPDRGRESQQIHPSIAAICCKVAAQRILLHSEQEQPLSAH